MEEAHNAAYLIHPGETKMYKDLKKNFWWKNMRREVARFVEQCLTCQKVKAERRRPAGELQPLPIPQWKWEDITMDFIVGLPRTTEGFDSIWVIVDRLTKAAHFLPVSTTFPLEKYAEIYMMEIVKLHGVPVTITSDRDTRFLSAFWKKMHRALGTTLQFSTAYHPQTDGQSERTNQILEDMLRACTLEFGGSWKKHLPYAELAYNNSYQTSLGMAPYEALYGKKCRTPICWDDVGQARLTNEEYVQQTVEVVQVIQQRLKAAQDRQKAQADKNRRPLILEEGQFVMLRVSPTRGVTRFERWRKLNPRFIGPFRVIKKVNPVAYQLELPADLARVHDVFHVSQLKPFKGEVRQAEGLVAQHEDLPLQEDLTYEVLPVKIVDRQLKKLRKKMIPQVRVQWDDRASRQDSWEPEEEMREKYPHLFVE